MIHSLALRRLVLAILAGFIVTGATSVSALLPAPALAYTYNCVNVVLRDPFWGQYRRTIESGVNAAGVPGALARAGFAVTNEPSAGAVMAWPPGYYGASGVGHVGIVVAINDNGTVLVRHENWPYGSAEHLQLFTLRPGYQFVHLPVEPEPAHAADADHDVLEDAETV